MSKTAKKASLLGGAGAIMAATLIAKFLGAMYRIPLTNMLGAEGMGVYQSVYPVYSLILSASGGAVPMAISLLVASYTASGMRKRALGLSTGALYVLLLSGGLLMGALMLAAPLIARFQGTPDAEVGYFAIAPAILFVSGISVMKGWFQGLSDMRPTALSHVTEAAGKLVLGLLLSYLLIPKGIKYAVAGALIGVTAGEAVTFFAVLGIFLKREGKFPSLPPLREAKENYKEILKISVPVGIGGLIFPFTQFLDSFTVVNILSISNSQALATAEYGLLSAPVNTLINLPVSLALGIGVAVAPHLAGSMVERDIDKIRLKLATSIKAAVAVGVPFTALFLAGAGACLHAIYPALSASELETATDLLRIGAFSVLFLAVMQISVSVLQGLGNTSLPIRNLAVAGSVKVVLGIVLLFVWGIRGAQLANLLSYAVGAALNLHSVFELTGKNIRLLKKSGVMLALGVIILVPTAIVGNLNAWAILAIAFVAGIVYIILLAVLPVFTKSELLSVPFGRKVAAIGEKIGIKRDE